MTIFKKKNIQKISVYSKDHHMHNQIKRRGKVISKCNDYIYYHFEFWACIEFVNNALEVVC